MPANTRTTTFYFALNSVIAGIAFNELLQSFFDNQSYLAIGLFIRHITILILLVFIWHEYAHGATKFNWILGMSDSSIPFLFGFSYQLSINNVQDYIDWYLGIITIIISGTIGYINQYVKIKKQFSNIKTSKSTKQTVQFLYQTVFISLFMVFLAIIQWLVAIKWFTNDILFSVLVLLEVLCAIAFIESKRSMLSKN